MAGTVEAKLSSLGIALPAPKAPIANYVPFVRSGQLLTVSGQVCFTADGKLAAKGQLGGAVSVEDGQQASGSGWHHRGSPAGRLVGGTTQQDARKGQDRGRLGPRQWRANLGPSCAHGPVRPETGQADCHAC